MNEEEDCQHVAWECSWPNVDSTWGAWHNCTDCDFCWGVNSNWGKKHQIGECSVCSESRPNKGEPIIDSLAKYITKDSGKREEYDSGMVRDTQDGKPRFDLLVPRDVPYSDQFLTRVAGLLGRGAEKYSDRNWEKAGGNEELERFKSSAFRHFFQWLNDESDEDHAAAVVFNLLAYETILYKLKAQNDGKATR